MLPGYRWWHITAWFEPRPFSHGGLGVEVDSLIGGHSVGRGEGRTRSAIACGAGLHGIVPGLFHFSDPIFDPLREGPREVIICLWRGRDSSAIREAARGPVGIEER